jgi:hypothetical protein
MKYAQTTTVSPEKSRAEIEGLLKKYGASDFGYMSSQTGAMVAFRYRNRAIEFAVPFPKETDLTPYKCRGRAMKRNPEQLRKEIEQEERRRWRALALSIKAKLETVSSGIHTFDQEFMSHFVLPNGKMLADVIIPQIDEAFKNGRAPALMLECKEGL